MPEYDLKQYDGNVLSDETIYLSGAMEKYPEKLRKVVVCDMTNHQTLTLLTNNFELDVQTIGDIYKERWKIGVSSQGHITKSVKVRPGIRDSHPVAWEVPLREIKMVKPSDNVFSKENMQHSRLQRTVNVDVASLHVNPVAETVDYVQRQQELTEKNLKRQFSPAGYQRWHGVNGYVETGEALDIRRRNPVEEAVPITLNGKWSSRYQGGGSGCSTNDRRAVKRASRKGPGPMRNPYVQREVVAR